MGLREMQRSKGRMARSVTSPTTRSQVCVPNGKSCHFMKTHYVSGAVLGPSPVQTLMDLVVLEGKCDHPHVRDDTADSERFYDWH